MRVLFCIELFLPHIGGAEIQSAHFVTAMKKRGTDFMIVTSCSGLDLPDVSSYNNIPVYRFPFHTTLLNRNMKDLMALRERIALLRQTYKPDLIHINDVGSNTFFHLQTASTHPAAILLTIHGMPMIQFSDANNLLGRTLNSANWIVAVSKATLNQIRQIAPNVRSRCSFIHNGLNMPDAHPLPLSFETPRLLCLGRLVDFKGFDLALTAFSSIRKRFPKAHLIMAGEGPVRSDLERQTAEMGLEDVVEFTGTIDPEKVSELINTSTIVIIPSRCEPFGLVALQAAQMGRPVIASRVDGLPEVVLDQHTGLLFGKNDFNALAKAMVYLLDHPDIAEQMGSAARTRAQKVFSLENNLDAYGRLYRKLST